MPLRHAAKFPERFLNPGTQGFKRFGEAQRHTFDIAVRQHAMEERVLESRSGNLHPEFIANRKVAGRQSSGVVFLSKEDRLPRPMQTPPFCDATFQRATRRIRKLARMRFLQPCEQRLRLEPRFHFQPLLNVVPDFGERVASRAIRAGCFLLRRQSVVAVFPCRFLTHFRHPC